jgi:hypothetical protein
MRPPDDVPTIANKSHACLQRFQAELIVRIQTTSAQPVKRGMVLVKKLGQPTRRIGLRRRAVIRASVQRFLKAGIESNFHKAKGELALNMWSIDTHNSFVYG